GGRGGGESCAWVRAYDESLCGITLEFTCQLQRFARTQLARRLRARSAASRSARKTFRRLWYGTSRWFASTLSSSSMLSGSRSEIVAVDGLRFGNRTRSAADQST